MARSPSLEPRAEAGPSVKSNGPRRPQRPAEKEDTATKTHAHDNANKADELMESDPEIVEVSAKARSNPKDKDQVGNNGSKPSSKGKISTTAPPAKSALRKTGTNASSSEVGEKLSTSNPAPMVDIAKAKSMSRTEARLLKQLEHTTEQLEQSKAREEVMRQKYEKLYASRKDEPDATLRAQIEEAQERINAQEAYIRELTSMQEVAQRLSAEPGMLHFFTRETAKQERLEVEEELARVKEELAAREEGEQVTLEDYRKDIIRLQEQKKEVDSELAAVRAELDAEIKRSKALAAKNAAPAPRGATNNNPNTPNSETTKLYEDLTNFLVLDCKLEKGRHPTQSDKVFHCICSSGRDGKALNFYLRMYWEPRQSDEKFAKEDLVEQCKYIPLDLDKETDQDFVSRLDFLSEPFTFAKDQLDVFAKTLVDRLAEPEPEVEISEQE